jgi:hypothetical protein
MIEIGRENWHVKKIFGFYYKFKLFKFLFQKKLHVKAD